LGLSKEWSNKPYKSAHSRAGNHSGAYPRGRAYSALSPHSQQVGYLRRGRTTLIKSRFSLMGSQHSWKKEAMEQEKIAQRKPVTTDYRQSAANFETS